MSRPCASVLKEYLLYYGENWIVENIGLSEDNIDTILYGSAIPTEERQRKKIEKAIKEDEAIGKFRVLSSYMNDSFIWDTPNKIHLRCINADLPNTVIRSNDFKDLFIYSYTKEIDKYLSYVKNRNGNHTINKTTSKSKDDIINDIYTSIYEKGVMKNWKTIESTVNIRMSDSIDGHGFFDESFIENTDKLDLDKIENLKEMKVVKLSSESDRYYTNGSISIDSENEKSNNNKKGIRNIYSSRKNWSDETKLKHIEWTKNNIKPLKIFWEDGVEMVRYLCTECGKFHNKEWSVASKANAIMCCEDFVRASSGVYIMSFNCDDKMYYKVGVSSNPEMRAKGICSNDCISNVNVLLYIRLIRNEAFDLEKEIITKFCDFKADIKNKFDGHSEVMENIDFMDIKEFIYRKFEKTDKEIILFDL